MPGLISQARVETQFDMIFIMPHDGMMNIEVMPC